MKSLDERIDMGGKQEEENAMMTVFKNEQKMIEHIREKIKGMEPFDEKNGCSIYKLSDDCYVCTENGRIHITNSDNIENLSKAINIGYTTSLCFYYGDYNGTYIPFNGIVISSYNGPKGQNISYQIVDKGRVLALSTIGQDIEPVMVDATRSNVSDDVIRTSRSWFNTQMVYKIMRSSDGGILATGTILEADPSKTKILDYLEEGPLIEADRSEEDARRIRFIKNDLAGLLEQMGVEDIEHVSETDMRNFELIRRDERLTADIHDANSEIESLRSQNDQLEARNEAITERAKDEISSLRNERESLRAQIEDLKAQLAKAQEAERSASRKHDSLITAVTMLSDRVGEVVDRAGPLTSRKKIAEIVKDEIIGLLPKRPKTQSNPSDSHDNR